MAKHIIIKPDCPNCGKEMVMLTKGFDFTWENPWGTRFEAWYVCLCGFETAHGNGSNVDEAKDKAKVLAGEYMPN